MADEYKIIVVGMGPGDPSYLLPAAREAIERARVLVGGRRALADYAREGQETFPITGDIAGVLSFIEERLECGEVTVLVSGDPGYFSLLDALRRHFAAERIEVIPGLSSMQLAFARVALPWHEARLVSLHGREPDREALAFAPGRIVGMLTDGVYNSRTVSELLLSLGWPRTARLYICLRLSYSDESITRTTLEGALALPAAGYGILIAADEGGMDS